MDQSASIRPSLTDTISKRLLSGIGRISEAIASEEISLKAGAYAVDVLVEAMLPFCSRDVVELSSKVCTAYREKVREEEIQQQHQTDLSRIVTPVTIKSGDEEAW